jgi:hypothetical protein
MPFIRAETALRRVLHYWLAPNAVSPSLGQAKLELVLHSDFCTMDNCSGSFPCCKRWEAIRHQLGRLWSSRPMLRTRSQPEPRSAEKIPKWYRFCIDGRAN